MYMYKHMFAFHFFLRIKKTLIGCFPCVCVIQDIAVWGHNISENGSMVTARLELRLMTVPVSHLVRSIMCRIPAASADAAYFSQRSLRYFAGLFCCACI